MKAIVFGGTGFIGSHVVEQLHKAGHDITVVIRKQSNTKFLKNLGVRTVVVDFSNAEAIRDVIKGHDVVYNCTADTKSIDGDVEIGLTRRIAEAADKTKTGRFIQLSTTILYDFKSMEPMNEHYPSQPEYPTQLIAMEREKVVQEIGIRSGMKTILLRPASTIGARDVTSFFSRMVDAHSKDMYPIVGKGDALVSIVDTRDIGRAMVFLGSYEIPDTEKCVYVLQGFQTTWFELKSKIDSVTDKVGKPLIIPSNLTEEQMIAYHVSPFMFKNLSTNRIWDDQKIKKLGFKTIYKLDEAISSYFEDVKTRVKE